MCYRLKYACLSQQEVSHILFVLSLCKRTDARNNVDDGKRLVCLKVFFKTALTTLTIYPTNER